MRWPFINCEALATNLGSRCYSNSEMRDVKALGLQLLRLWEVADPALGHSVEAGSKAKEFQATGELRGEGGACPRKGFPHQGSSKGHRGPGERRAAGEVGCVEVGWQNRHGGHRVWPPPRLSGPQFLCYSAKILYYL